MNFLTMTDRVCFTLGLEDTTVNDERALAREYLNEGVVDILSRTRPGTRCINLVAAANTPVHDMSNTILALLDLQAYEGGPFLERFSREDILSAQQGGARGFAYEEPLLWISPVSTEDRILKAYGVFRPQPMVADNDDCSMMAFGGLAPEFHPAAVNYAPLEGRRVPTARAVRGRRALAGDVRGPGRDRR